MNEFLNAKHIIASVCLSLLIVSAFGRADNIMASSEIGGYIISIIFIVYGVIIGQWAYKRYKDVVKNNTLRVILIIVAWVLVAMLWGFFCGNDPYVGMMASRIFYFIIVCFLSFIGIAYLKERLNNK